MDANKVKSGDSSVNLKVWNLLNNIKYILLKIFSCNEAIDEMEDMNYKLISFVFKGFNSNSVCLNCSKSWGKLRGEHGGSLLRLLWSTLYK